MNYDTVDAETFGASLQGLGLNLLVRDVPGQAQFLCAVFGMTAHQISDDFAIIVYGSQVFQLHSDRSYGAHPLLGLLPEAGARGGGLEIRLYDTDPDAAATRAETHGAVLLHPPVDKPHGLRETCILCDNGYAWVASLPKSEVRPKEPDT
jgi:predicted enzyme related to lactoylglutathione lyase